MSLYVRLQLSFWNHRKTLRLRAAIGDAALWIPPRLWSYAAANQPDGDFSDYTPEEIAMLLEYSGNAHAMLEALLKAGFMDEGPRIHDWPEHNAYHSGFRERAKVAANARWEKARAKKERVQEKKVQERKGKEPSIASSMLGASKAGSDSVLEEIYSLYPKKVGKPDALRAIGSALKRSTPDHLRERTAAYAKARGGDLAFVPNPSTWFNQDRFNDDPSTWVPKPVMNGAKVSYKIPDPNQERRDREYEAFMEERRREKAQKP